MNGTCLGILCIFLLSIHFTDVFICIVIYLYLLMYLFDILILYIFFNDLFDISQVLRSMVLFDSMFVFDDNDLDTSATIPRASVPCCCAMCY